MLSDKIGEFGECYQEAVKVWLDRSGLPTNLNVIRYEPFYTIMFITGAVHERAGANPEFPKYHRMAIRNALNGKDIDEFSSVVLCDIVYANKVWEEFQRMTDGKPNEDRTIGPVKQLLVKIMVAREANIVTLLGSMSIEKAIGWLRGLKGVGPKLSTFIVRDFECFFHPWSGELKQDPMKYRFCQPVDRWVRRVSELCWKNIKLDYDHDKKAENITRRCVKNHVDPIRFNQGAWFTGRYFDQLLRFHDLPEQKFNEESIWLFDPKKILQGIRGLNRFLAKKEVFLL